MALRILNVHSVPQQVPERELADSTVVVIDLLRVSTTICQALASGAIEVIPYATVQQAMAQAIDWGREKSVLGGERGGKRIADFDLGNSPSEYTPAAVHGRRVIMTTTNGTRALKHARLAERVIVGAVVNLSAAAAYLQDAARVDILCAGTDGQVTREDILAAGALAHQLLQTSPSGWQLRDSATAARKEWETLVTKGRAAGRNPSEQLAIELRETQGGLNLVEIGLDNDLVDCARIDRLDVVPEFDVRAWRITAM